MPFEEKGQDMRAKAFEIASRFAIEEVSFAAISEPFFAENPSQAKALKGEVAKRDAKATAACRLPPRRNPLRPSRWVSASSHSSTLRVDGRICQASRSRDHRGVAYENPALYIKGLWARSIQSNRLQQVAFFMQEAQEKALIQAGIMGTVKAISLSAAGARGEGFAELEEARRDLTPDAQARITKLLVQFYEHSYAREKSKELLKDLKKDEPQKVSFVPAILMTDYWLS